MRPWLCLMIWTLPGVVAAQSADPAQTDSLYLAGRRHLSGGDYQGAIDALGQLARLDIDRKKLADAQYWQAFALYHLGGAGNLRQAAALLAAAVAGRTHHPDAVALLTRVRARLGPTTLPRVRALPCRERDAAVDAERLGGLAAHDSSAARAIAEAVLRAPTVCAELVRRTAVIVLGESDDPQRFIPLRLAAEHDPAPLLRVDALHRLRADTSHATLSLMIQLASQPATNLVTQAAASHLAWMPAPGARQALARFLADTTVPTVNRQSALSQLRLDGAIRLDPQVLRALLPRLAGGSAQSTLLEVIARHGDAGDREWIWRVASDESVAPLARVTGLQQVANARQPAELGALFSQTRVRLVCYAVLEQLRDHADPTAGVILRGLWNSQPPGVMRDAIVAALESRGRKQ